MSKETKNPYFLAVAIALLIIVTFVFGIEPQKALIAEKFNEVTGLTADRQQAQQYLNQSTRFQADFQSVLDQEARLNRYLFARGQELQFFQTLEERAAATGVKLTVQFNPPVERTNATVIPASLAVSGTWPNIVVFLNELERLPQYLTVKSINLQAGEETGGTIEINSYWYEPQSS